MDPAVELEVASSSRLKDIREAAAAGDSDVQRFYCGRVVFLTGGSGFLGKQLVEKLLRTCKISKIYMLLRPKKGKSVKQRIKDLLNESAFDKVREQQHDFGKKIIPIQGDVSELSLGINDEDWKTLTNEVDIIFHGAATTRFDESIRVATLINLRGTRECLKLGKACKNLCSFVHVSTAYTHTTSKMSKNVIEEKFNGSPVPPDALISIAENLEDDRLNGITASLIKDWPNTYSFTKAVTEELIRTTSEGLPICIVKPGIVIHSLCEPSPGWLDSSAIYTATGIIAGVALGIMHTAYTDVNVNLGLVPCDYVNNAIIVAAREAAVTQTRGGMDTKLYSVTCLARNPITWYKTAKIMREDGATIPTSSAIYYYCLLETKYRVIFAILSLLFHVIPACIIDLICLLLGKERRFVNLSKKIYNMSNALSYFLLNSWRILDNNTISMYKSLSKVDQTIFNFDVATIDWDKYIVLWCLGIRKYLFKDGLRDTIYARNKQKVLGILHYFVLMPIYVYGLYNLVYFVISSIIFGLVMLFKCK